MENAGDLKVAIRVTNKVIDSVSTRPSEAISLEILRNQVAIMEALIEIGEILEKK